MGAPPQQTRRHYPAGQPPAAARPLSIRPRDPRRPRGRGLRRSPAPPRRRRRAHEIDSGSAKSSVGRLERSSLKLWPGQRNSHLPRGRALHWLEVETRGRRGRFGAPRTLRKSVTTFIAPLRRAPRSRERQSTFPPPNRLGAASARAAQARQVRKPEVGESRKEPRREVRNALLCTDGKTRGLV